MCCGWKSRAEPRLRSGLTLKFYKFQSRHSGEKRGYRCCRSPYGSVVANDDSPWGCLRSFRRNPRRVALDACTPFGLQARPYGPPVGSVFAARRCAVLAAKREGSPAGEAKEQIMRLRLESAGLLPQPRQSISNGFKQRGAGTGGPAAPIARMF